MGQIVRKGVLGETIRNFAAVKDLSISSLEKNAGYSPGMISRWIAAGPEDYYSLSKLVALADLLDVSLDELVRRQRNTEPKGSLSDPVLCLMDETRSGRLVWWKWRLDDDMSQAGPAPTHESGRPCCGGWQTRRDHLEFLLALFCDDVDDEDEPMELSLYCTPGHRLPLFAVPDAVPDALSNLYTQILFVDAFAERGNKGLSAVLPFNAQDSKTITFRCPNDQCL